MFKEIAVEPAAVAVSDLQFRYIIEKFGIAEGRLRAANKTGNLPGAAVSMLG